jgi:hypothetical protein
VIVEVRAERRPRRLCDERREASGEMIENVQAAGEASL